MSSVKQLVRLCVLALTVLVLGLSGVQPLLAGPLAIGGPSVRLIAEVEGGPVHNLVEDLLGRVGQKIDLNNTNIAAFRKIPGLYPTAARLIVQNAPYEKVEDVLKLPQLSETQQERIRQNLDRFTVGPTLEALERDRINNGIYR